MEQSTDEVTVLVIKDWKLITYRCAVLIYILICFILNIWNAVIHIKMIHSYLGCSTCDFTQYEILILIVNHCSIISLFVATYLVLFQKLLGMRVYIMVFFLITWLQMLLTLVMVNLFPLAYVVHVQWTRGESLSDLEKTYECCGVLGADDYLLNEMELPSSCFLEESLLFEDLYDKGCLTRLKGGTSIFRVETLPVLFQFALAIMILLYYRRLKHNNAQERTLDDLRTAYILY